MFKFESTVRNRLYLLNCNCFTFCAFVKKVSILDLTEICTFLGSENINRNNSLIPKNIQLIYCYSKLFKG